MARQFVEGGLADCVLALGFEKMERGSLRRRSTRDRTQPDRPALRWRCSPLRELREPRRPPPQIFGNAGREHMERYGTERRPLAADRLARTTGTRSTTRTRSSRTSTRSTRSSRAKAIHRAADQAAVLADLRRRGRRGRRLRAVRRRARPGRPGGRDRRPGDDHRHWRARSTPAPASRSSATTCPRAARPAGVRAGRASASDDVDVIELHDCFSANELITYEALGLCGEGEGDELVDDEATTYGGRWVVNPSGGLISKGHPLGATGLAQCSRAHLAAPRRGGRPPGRRRPGRRSQHNIGLGGAAVVSVYRPPE